MPTMNSKTLATLLCTLLAFVGTTVHAQTPLRLCTYNVLKWSESNEDGRMARFRTILDSIRPSILVAQEVDDPAFGPRFIAEVFSFGQYAATPFIDGNDTDNTLLYDQTKLQLLSQRRIATALRDIAEFVLVVNPEEGRLPDTLVVYSLHLKASDGTAEARQRTDEVRAMLQSMSPVPNIIVCGDFNIYSPNEQAYQALVGGSATRRFIDPLGTTWQRNSSSFASFYTQCTRVTTLGQCGGGVDGGLDDRFDFILASNELFPSLVPNTYTVLGNDGLSRVNSSITSPPNQKVSVAMAEALLCASDHLPVFVDFVLGQRVASIVTERLLPVVQSRNGSLLIRNVAVGATIRISDVAGREWYKADVTSVPMNVSVQHLPAGAYVFNAGGYGTIFYR
jgi:hypothetical protein